MDAKQISNKVKKFRGERVFIDPPNKLLGKHGKAEWNRLINNFYISEGDLGTLTIACQSYETYLDLYEMVTTEYYEDAAGRKRKKKISIAEYTFGRTSQQQVEITTMNKALDNYNKIIKRLQDNNSLTGFEENEQEASQEEMEMMKQLL